MKKHIFILFIALFAWPLYGVAQDSVGSQPLRSQGTDITAPPNFSDNVIYPFPSSSVFKKYTGSQPSLSTGTVNIPIGLYELRYRDITIPFTLRYSTSGIKVFDESYPTGLGWTLTPGLRLTRQIMNRPDEQYRRIKYSPSALEYDSLFLSSILVDEDHFRQDSVDYVDSQHDIFTLYLINDSYTFVMDRNADGTYTAIGDDFLKLRIETDTCFSHFTVTDNSGVKYDFGGVTEYRGIPENITAWMLDSVTLVNGDVLTFSWGLYRHSSEKEFSASTVRDDFGSGKPEIDNDTYISSSSIENLALQPTSSIEPHAHLTGVQFPTGHITFSYKMGNAAQNRYPKLETIQVTNSENESVKRIELAYDSVSVTHQFLESVWISDEGTYSFDYNKVDIPYNNRYAQDWWGYYNGVTSNATRVPQVTMRTYLAYASGEFNTFGEGDRSVNANHMQANMLTRVHYPLGGTASFEYEPHTWRFSQMNGKTMPSYCIDSVFGETVTGGGLRVKRITLQASANAAPEVTEYKYGTGEDGMAECVAMPLPHTFINNRRAYNHLFWENSMGPQFSVYTFRESQISPESQYMKWHLNETPVWYKEVTEYKGGGKTVYRFDKKGNDNSVVTDWGGGYPGHIRALSSKGAVSTSVEQYSFENGSWNKLRTRSFDYELVQGPQLTTDFEVQRKAATGVSDQPFRPDVQCGAKVVEGTTTTYLVPFEESECYQAHFYTIEFYTERLKGVSDTLATPSGDRVMKTLYSYAPHSELVTAKTTVVNGDTVRRETLRYPFHDNLQLAAGQQLYMDSLVNANRISSPFYASVTREGLSTETVTEYGSSGGLIMPAGTLTRRNNAQRTVAAYRYDNRGNILEISHDNGFRTESFLWGYGRELPVAAIAGNSYAEIEQALGANRIDSIAQSHGPAPESIRTDLAGGLLQTYGYKPLVGLIAIRDFKGAATTFGYDGANRLERVTDANGSAVERYSYSTYSDSLSNPAHGSTPLVGGSNSIVRRTMLDGLGGSHIESVMYYDGLGREETELTRDFWQGGAIATLQTYDSLGHADRKWLPVPVLGNGYASPSQIMARGISTYNDARPYTESVYLPFAADSVTAIYGPGAQWAEIGASVASFVNTDTVGRLRCARFTVAPDGSLVNHGTMARGRLLATESTDEDGHTRLTFTDAEGRTALSRAVLGDTLADTYYVYDGYGQLRYVLPPEASAALAARSGQWGLSNDTIGKYCYAYRYNDYGECVERKLPGRESVLTHYDNGGRPVLVQDGNLRAKGLWRVWLRDKYGRTAVVMDAGVADPAQWAAAAGHAAFTGTGPLAGYAINWEMPSSREILRVNYYDGYDFLSNFTAHSDSLAYVEMTGYDSRYQGGGDASARGLLTGTATRVLGDTVMLAGAVYYDLRGNTVQSHARNHLGGYEHQYRRLSFTGKPLEVMDVRTTADTAHVDIHGYGYDGMERLLTASARHDGAPVVTLGQHTYDSLGRLAERTLGPAAHEAVGYTYNLRGWVTGIDCPGFFRQTLRYTDADEPCYNGDVAAVEWNDGNAAANVFRYDYDYDGLDRLTAADFSVRDAATGEPVTLQHGTPNYSTSYAYDLNSNLTSLTRNGYKGRIRVGASYRRLYGPIDDVVFTLDGNRAVRATDLCDDLTIAGAMEFTDKANKAVEYAYDANGNLTADHNRGITAIAYNELDLPERITFDDGKRIYYTYAADGRKLRVRYAQLNSHVGPITPIEGPSLQGGTAGLNGGGMGDPGGGLEPVLDETVLLTRDYCGGHVWRNDTLERVNTDYGYFDGTGTYHAYVKDHQGNVRAVVAGGEAVERDDYYPYGMPIAGACQPSAEGVQPLKYTSKELDRFNRLDLYDFGARPYDPTRCAFLTHDPLAEDDPATGPTAFCAANPIRFTDPTGMEWENLNDEYYLLAGLITNTYILQLENEKLSKSTASKDTEQRINENSERILFNILSMYEVLQLGKDSHRYALASTGGNGAHYVKKGQDGVIQIEGSSIGMFVHEMAHVVQWLNQRHGEEFQFDGNACLYNPGGTDISKLTDNEVNAYLKQYSIEPDSYPLPIAGIQDINHHSLWRIKDDSGSSAYPFAFPVSNYRWNIEKKYGIFWKTSDYRF